MLIQEEGQFEYHTFLHHSQTHIKPHQLRSKFEYHTFLHHSQTGMRVNAYLVGFEYHTFLHHSQTLTYILSKLCFSD